MSEKNNGQVENDSDALARFLDGLRGAFRFQIHRCVNVQTAMSWGFRGRVNPDFHVILVRGGQGTYELNGTPEPLVRGKVIFVSAGFRHSASPLPGPPPAIIPVRFGVCRMETGAVEEEHEGVPFCIAHAAQAMARFERLFEDLHAVFAAGVEDGLRQGICHALLYEILAWMVVEIREGRQVMDPRIRRVRDHILANPAGRVSVDKLAAMAGLSPKYFARLFAEQTGRSPLAFQILARCKAAAIQMEGTGRSVKDVAKHLGYPDPFTFSKQFRRYIGRSPSGRRIAWRGA